MRFSRSKTECPPLERLAIPSKEDLRSKGLHCDAKRAVIVSRNIRLNSIIRRKIILHIYKLEKIHFHFFIITSLFAYEQVSSGDFQCTAVSKNQILKKIKLQICFAWYYFIFIYIYVCVCLQIEVNLICKSLSLSLPLSLSLFSSSSFSFFLLRYSQQYIYLFLNR